MAVEGIWFLGKAHAARNYSFRDRALPAGGADFSECVWRGSEFGESEFSEPEFGGPDVAETDFSDPEFSSSEFGSSGFGSAGHAGSERRPPGADPRCRKR